MSTLNLKPLFHKNCRFKLKSGREVYGVIWEEQKGLAKRYYFASIGDYEKMLKCVNGSSGAQIQQINIEDVLLAENLAS